METQTIYATLEYLIFENKSTHYAVGSFSQTETYHTFIGAGRMLDPIEDIEYELQGRYVRHPRYGMQFQIDSSMPVLPKKEKAIVRFLSGTDFPAIGKKTAQKIYDTLGEDCLEMIKAAPEILDTVESLTRKQKKTITEGLSSYDGFNALYTTLSQYGLDQNKITLLSEAYEDVMEVLNENCFRPYYEVQGFGYKSALKLADGMGMDAKDFRRQDACIHEFLRQQSMKTGNTYVTKSELLGTFSKLSEENLDLILDRLVKNTDVDVEEERIYPFNLRKEEREIARLLKIHSFKVDAIPKKELRQKIEEIEFANAIQYDEQQISAIQAFFSRSITILNGGPGTGKTTIIKAIVNLYRSYYPQGKLQLCAPTGRASKRLSELTKAESKTLHSLLKWNKEDNTFAVNEDAPLDVDVIIIDEFSMVDTHLFACLLKALPDHARIALVGDENQLESVGPGRVFADILASGCFYVTHLEKIFRQKDGSGIARLAQNIRLELPSTYDDGVTFVQMPTTQIIHALQEMTQEYDLNEFQILAPMYNGSAGIDAVNQILQEQFNPAGQDRASIKVGTTIFREKDKVMLLKNLPDEDVYNGDIGTIETIDNSTKDAVIAVDFGHTMVDFDHDFLYYLKHAYCISVHKAQGSEYPVVFCIVDRGAISMLDKRLLYTAISRAKQKLIILGQQDVFENRVRLNNKKIRRTTLCRRIMDYQG